MLSPLRNRFGIPGVISVIALVFAMFGGAYAATNDGGGAKATASAKGKPGPRGKQGKQGKPGPAGPQGPAGAQGPAGPAGAKGDKGDNGGAGANGKSAEAIAFIGGKGPIGGVTCTAGGLEVKSASATTLVCNGKNGTNGVSGFTATLPSEQTETGTYLLSSEEGNGVIFGAAATTLSFPIPLPEPLETADTIFVPQFGSVPADCQNTEHAGTASFENPEATPGFLCVFEAAFNNTEHGETEIKKIAGGYGADVVGATIGQTVTGAGAFSRGTWAVTAP